MGTAVVTGGASGLGRAVTEALAGRGLRVMVAVWSAVATATAIAAQNLAEHAIRAVGIAPGPFRTPMLDGLPAALSGFSEQALHPKAPGEPRHFAALVEHIMDNPMLNGDVIRLDGGTRLGPPPGTRSR